MFDLIDQRFIAAETNWIGVVKDPCATECCRDDAVFPHSLIINTPPLPTPRRKKRRHGERPVVSRTVSPNVYILYNAHSQPQLKQLPFIQELRSQHSSGRYC